LVVSLPRPLLMRIFQMAWEKVCSPGSVLSFSHLNAMIGLLSKPTDKIIKLPYGYIFSTEYQHLRLGAVRILEDWSEAVLLPSNGLCQSGPWQVHIQQENMGSFKGTDWIAQDPFSAMLDADVLCNPLVMRRKRRGDMFHPLGMTGLKFLRDFFVDAKVPREERKGTPLIVAGSNIAWVVGHRVAEWAKITEHTSRIMKITVRKM
jgi:tRNA(Ile)-lysidine synthase